MHPRSLLDGIVRRQSPPAWRVDATLPVREHMRPGLHYVEPNMPADELAQFMADAGVTEIPVLDESQRPLGLVSSSDLRQAIGDELSRVRDIMVFGIATVHQSVPLARAAARMMHIDRKLLVVVDDDGAAVGSLVMPDIRRWMVDHTATDEVS